MNPLEPVTSTSTAWLPLLSTTRVSYQHTYAERTNGEGVPTLAMLGVKSWMYTQGKIPGQDMLKAGLWNSGNTGTFYVDTPQYTSTGTVEGIPGGVDVSSFRGDLEDLIEFADDTL